MCRLDKGQTCLFAFRSFPSCERRTSEYPIQPNHRRLRAVGQEAVNPLSTRFYRTMKILIGYLVYDALSSLCVLRTCFMAVYDTAEKCEPVTPDRNRALPGSSRRYDISSRRRNDESLAVTSGGKDEINYPDSVHNLSGLFNLRVWWLQQ